MDKTTLHKIFSKAFEDASWLEVLKSVFGAKLGLLAQAKPIILANNDKANAAFELGSFTTTDDRIIGLYKIEVKPEVWLERNKVGLRELLRNVYKYDVDGAIIIFIQQNKWRLSFVSEIKVLSAEGEIIEQATEPKRYTYLLGDGEKVRTPSDSLSKLSGKSLSLQDILNAFSVEALNEEFYKIIQAFFYELVGGKIGKGNKISDYGKGILQLPNVTKENRQIYQEFAVRLIGRTVFCWFLKMKKSDEGAPLLPENLLSSKAVKKNTGYYHSILERLFFQTLNTPIEQRVENLPEGAEQIPFLNGGLFEPGNQDYYKPNKVTGLNENLNTLKIDDQWFIHFFEELEKYNFTIDENSVTDVEVSVDPEMLGRIFENLLAEIDPDSGETARKATGSFYTPREIVDYMATESLVQYIHNKTNLSQDKVRPIFKMMDKQKLDFSKAETEAILDALDKVKILDPACGSGAFPMGVLQKIVQALQKLDTEAEWWKKRQVARVSNAIVRKQLKEKLESSGVEYARKIGVIQNSLYGVDIQPVAAEISKLRCFLSLVVDENIDESKPNRGIEPLPNLEFKFVTADTLIKLPEANGQRGMFDNWEEMQELEELRNDYIQSYGKQKQRIKEQFLKVQHKMFKDQLSLFSDKTSRAYQLSTWNPFSHEKSGWFDPKWMFGVEKFDIVIGNPPYVQLQSIKKYAEQLKQERYDSFTPSADLYCLFYEKGYSLIDEQYGVLAYITSNMWMRAGYGKLLREFFIKHTNPLVIIDFGDTSLFKSATTYTNILIGSRSNTNHKAKVWDISKAHNRNVSLEVNLLKNNSFTPDFTTDSFQILTDKEKYIRTQAALSGIALKKWNITINRGLITGLNEAFIIDKPTKEKIVKDDFQSSKLIFPILNGKDISKYNYRFDDQWIIAAKYGSNEEITNKYKGIHKHLSLFESNLKSRGQCTNRGGKGQHHWLELDNNPNDDYLNRFLKPKIIWGNLNKKASFSVDLSGIFVNAPSNFLTTDSKDISIPYLAAVLNSSLTTFLMKFIGYVRRGGYVEYKKVFVEKLPVPQVTTSETHSFVVLVSYIIALHNQPRQSPINEFVENKHLISLFEEVIDAMVMELYFKEDFEKAGIEFIKYAERDFESIEEKPKAQQIEIIHKSYQKLREKDNEIRNNLKLMDIKLADIVMPIKAAK